MSGILSFVVAGVGGSSLDVTANDVTRTQSGFAGSGTVTTIQVPTPLVVGGMAPYTYLWARTSGSTAPVVSSATAENPTWSATVTDGAAEIATWELTVTDDSAATATVSILVSLNWFNFS